MFQSFSIKELHKSWIQEDIHQGKRKLKVMTTLARALLQQKLNPNLQSHLQLADHPQLTELDHQSIQESS